MSIAPTIPPGPEPALSTRWRGRDGVRAKNEALDALRAGTRDLDLRGATLVGEDLRGLDLSGIDLSGVDLSRADLEGARLLGATLVHATLTDAKLARAELAGADLRGARLDGADLSAAGLGETDLRAASLFGATLEGASLVGAKLRGADLRSVHAAGARFAGADLSRAELARAELVDADLERTTLAHASLVEADLRRARLRNVRRFASATFLRADVRDVDWNGAHLLRRQILDECFLDEFRSQSRGHHALYWVWWVSSDCGRSLARWTGWTLAIAIAFGFAYMGVDVDGGDHATWLTPFYFSLVTLSTLGYGDVLPASTAAQAVAMAEVAIGYLMLGGLVSIFSNKLARRAE